MKLSVYHFGVVTFTIAIVCLGLVAVNNASRKDTQVNAKQQIPFEQPAAANLPVFPGAILVEEDKSRVPEQHFTVYEASATYEELSAFYQENLTSVGWVPARRPEFVSDLVITGIPEALANEPFTHVETYPPTDFSLEWVDPTGKVPYYLSLWLRFAEGSTEGKHKILATLKYIPDVDRLPTYPGARELEVKDGVDDITWIEGVTDAGTIPVSMTSYIADANQHEVEAYFKEILPKYGWHWKETKPHRIEFSWFEGGPVGRGVGVSLNTEPIDTDATRVEVRIR